MNLPPYSLRQHATDAATRITRAVACGIGCSRVLSVLADKLAERTWRREYLKRQSAPLRKPITRETSTVYSDAELAALEVPAVLSRACESSEAARSACEHCPAIGGGCSICNPRST